MENKFKNNIIFIIPIIVLLAICLFLITSHGIKNGINRELIISVDGKQYTFENGEKPSLDKDTRFTIRTDYGFNTIDINNHSISVIDSDCRDEICIKTGKINFNSDNDMIVCAPHRLCIYIR